jgi:hypothetical protein
VTASPPAEKSTAHQDHTGESGQRQNERQSAPGRHARGSSKLLGDVSPERSLFGDDRRDDWGVAELVVEADADDVIPQLRIDRQKRELRRCSRHPRGIRGECL